MGSAGTVLWKEMHEQYLRGGRPAVTFLVSAALDVLVGAVLPIAFASSLPVASRGPLVSGILLGGGLALVGFMALMGPLAVAVDAIAGERERHTLETLLATPLPDRAIVLGKAGAILLMVGVNVAIYLVSATAAAVYLLGFAGLLVAGLLALVAPPLAFLAATYTTGLGFLISQRAATVKQGQQWLGYAMMPFFLLPGVSGLFTSRLFMKGPPIWMVVAGVAGAAVVFLLLNALFWVLALTRFRRNRLLAR